LAYQGRAGSETAESARSLAPVLPAVTACVDSRCSVRQDSTAKLDDNGGPIWNALFADSPMLETSL
jgi:hypothetical protein